MFNLLSPEPVYFSDTFEPIAKWLTVGILAFFIIAWLTIYLIKFFSNRFGKKTLSINLLSLAKKFLITFIVYALVLGILLLVLEIMKKYDSNYLENNWVNKQIVTHVFIPLLVTAIISLSCVVTLLIASKYHKKSIRLISFIFGLTIAVSFIVSFVLIYFYYSNNIVGDGYYTNPDSKFNSLALYVCSIMLVLLVVALAFILGRKNKKSFDTKMLSLAGVCLALSFTLSYIKFEAAWIQGGSITLVSFLPICIFSYVYGMKKGLLVGII